MNTGFLGPAVATVLTVYGIETPFTASSVPFFTTVATVLTVYGIETLSSHHIIVYSIVATVLTVYGIETHQVMFHLV